MGLRFKLLIILCCAACSLPACALALAGRQTSGPDADARVQEFFHEGSLRFAKGDYAGAARAFRQALSIEPDSPQLLSNLGIAFHMEGLSEQAIGTLRHALALNPNMPPANLILGLELVKVGQPKQAIAPLKRLLSHDPSNLDGQLGLASAYFALHQYVDAARLYQGATRIRPADADAWYGEGISFEHLAENTARQMARTDPHSPFYLRLLGEYLLREGAEPEAAQSFRQALVASRGNDDLELRSGLGFALLALGQGAEAEGDFKKELQLHPGSLEARLGLAAVEISSGRNEEAYRRLCEVYATDPAFYKSHLSQFASDLASIGAKNLPSNHQVGARCSVAIELLRREMAAPGTVSASTESVNARNEAPAAIPGTAAKAKREAVSGHYDECAKLLEGIFLRHTGYALLLARCASLSGRNWPALEAARHALQSDPHNVAAQYWQAEAAGRLARAAFERAVALNPDSWQGHVLLGDIYRQRKQWELAISNYEEAAKLKPSSPAPYVGIATVHWQNGDFSQSQTALGRALALDPSNLQANWELGDILVRRHQFQQAVPYLQKVALGEPALLAAHADLGKSYAALGDTTLAVQELRRALPSDRDGQIHYLLAQQYKKEGLAALASKALAESQRIRGESLRRHQNILQEALGASRRKPGGTH